MFDNHILDMFEVSVVSCAGDCDNAFKVFDLNVLPVFMCFGDVFETDPQMGRIRNYFADFFSAFRNEKVFLNVDFGLQMVVTMNGFEDKTLILNVFRFDRAKGELVDLGVKLVMKVGRTKLAEDDKWREACKKVKLEKKRREDRNREMNTLGETMGRVFVRQQDLKTLRLKRIKKRTGKKEEGQAQETEQGEAAEE